MIVTADFFGTRPMIAIGYLALRRSDNAVTRIVILLDILIFVK